MAADLLYGFQNMCIKTFEKYETFAEVIFLEYKTNNTKATRNVILAFGLRAINMKIFT
jgi:hypothetical protein